MFLRFLWGIVFAFMTVFSSSAALAKHNHGEAEIALAIEGKHLKATLRAPALHIYGFEREPKDAKEMARREGAVQKLNREFVSILTLDPSLSCKVTSQKIDPLKGESDAKVSDHGDVVATFEFQCVKALKGSSAFVKIAHVFPEIKKLEISATGDSSISATAGKNGLRISF